MCIALCTIVAHNIAQNRPDSFPPYPPDDHHISDDVYLREGGKLALYWQPSQRSFSRCTWVVRSPSVYFSHFSRSKIYGHKWHRICRFACCHCADNLFLNGQFSRQGSICGMAGAKKNNSSGLFSIAILRKSSWCVTSYQDALVSFAFYYDLIRNYFTRICFKNLFLLLKLCLCVVARLVVNIQHSIGCLVVFSSYDVITCEK